MATYTIRVKSMDSAADVYSRHILFAIYRNGNPFAGSSNVYAGIWQTLQRIYAYRWWIAAVIGGFMIGWLI